MSCMQLLILHLCPNIIITITYLDALKLWHAFLTRTVPAGPSILLLLLLPLLQSSTRSVHTSPQHQNHPCCYVRAMQGLTNQIIIATGHTLREDRGQWSNMANEWTDAGSSLDRGDAGMLSWLGARPIGLCLTSIGHTGWGWAASLRFQF